MSEDLFGEKLEASLPKTRENFSPKPSSNKNRPLADLMRPKTIDEMVGQVDLIGPKGKLMHMLEVDNIPSMILWGPPGCGKTTLARLIADRASRPFLQISAVFSGVADLKKAFQSARDVYQETGVTPILFVDEIHRFNRMQQDAFLPVVEEGEIILIGATTENPSFTLNPALLSRSEVLVFKRLKQKELEDLLERAQSFVGRRLPVDQDAQKALIAMADGDGRYLLNLAERLFSMKIEGVLTPADLATLVSKRALLYDRNREEHYGLISALHKSMRGSDPDASLYWFSRMLEGGEDPRYIGRRLVRLASEDIGIADPQSLLIATAACQTYERLGSPEGELALAHAVVHLATAPKSNAVYKAYKTARALAKQTGSEPPPPNILNAPTALMENLGYGAEYHYDHDCEDAFSGDNFFPPNMKRPTIYEPTDRGYEKEVKDRVTNWNSKRLKKLGK